jgi:Mg-chelatase subunit ChlD
MMKLIKTVLFSVAALSIVGCNQSSNSGSSSNATSNGSSASAQKRVKSDWPYLSTIDQSQVGIESDLLLKNYIVVFDDSGSMDGSKIVDGKNAVKQFINNIPDGVNVAFSTLNKGLRQGFTQDKQMLLRAVSQVNAGGGTPLETSIKLGFHTITKQAQKQLGYGQFGIIVVTDGDPSAGEDPTGIVNKLINETPIEVHTIGFHLGSNHVLNSPGRTFYTSASNVADLVNAMTSVLAESESFDVSEFKL